MGTRFAVQQVTTYPHPVSETCAVTPGGNAARFLQTTVTAIEIARPGGPEVLRPVERAVPEPGVNEVLIRVYAAGVNRPDILQRQGRYPPPHGASDIPGLEISGTVERVGQVLEGEISRWRPGNAVCALVTGGGYAEWAVAPAKQCLPVPPGVDLMAAAAIPETYFTVWTNLFQRSQLRTGETVLVHGGASGIGTTAIQLARAFGATVFATAGTDERCAACEKLGAAAGLNYRAGDFAEAIAAITSGLGVNVILDIVGGEYLERNLKSLAFEGRLIQIGLLGGARAQINLATIMQRRLTLTGSTLRARSVAEKAAIARDLEQHVWPLLSSGIVAPVIHRTFPLAEAGEAHRLLESGEVIGKLVLTTGAA
jgi:NADPH:quinone reductase